MSLPYVVSSGETPKIASDEWITVLEIPGTNLINWISVVNNGDEPGFWRLVDLDGNESPPAHLIVGGGEPGSRRAGFNIPCGGFSGKFQIRADGGRLVTGVFAFGMK
jgi:hypothetical protein